MFFSFNQFHGQTSEIMTSNEIINSSHMQNEGFKLIPYK
uniref:Uncharacterized protein n=1 Tax=Arundo donax TaxID=35708 RepID=A0A0A9ARD4_ARUDO